LPPIPTPLPRESGPAKARRELPSPAASTRLSGVNLGGVVLLLPASPDDATLAEITAVAQPLIALLAERGLLHLTEGPTEGAHE
jgi:hypothetical protein